MHPLQHSRALGLLLACLLPVTAAAQQSGPLRLADLVDDTLARSPNREIPAALAGEGSARLAQAGSLFAADPALVVRHQTDQFGAQAGFREWEAGLEAPLWLPGQQHERRREAQRYQAEADATAVAQRWEVAGEVRERLWQLLIARERVAQAQAALVGAQELEHLVARRVAAGELPRTELNLSRQDSLDRAAELQQQRNELAAAEAHYRRYTGTDALPVDHLESLQAGAVLDEDHPRLQLARAALERGQASRDRTRGERRDNPTLYLSGLQSRDHADADYDGSLNLEVRVPLGLSSQAGPAVAAAERQVTELAAELGQLRRELLETLQYNAAEYQALQDQVRLSEQRRELADEVERLARRAFDLGESDLFKLLAARQQALAARRRLEVGRLEVGRAIARYNQAAGVLPR